LGILPTLQYDRQEFQYNKERRRTRKMAYHRRLSNKALLVGVRGRNIMTSLYAKYLLTYL